MFIIWIIIGLCIAWWVGSLIWEFLTSPIESTKEILKFIAFVILGLTAIAALFGLKFYMIINWLENL